MTQIPKDTTNYNELQRTTTNYNELSARAWLAAVADHPETTDADYAAAVAVLRDWRLTGEQVDVSNLARLEFVIMNPGGTHTANFPLL